MPVPWILWGIPSNPWFTTQVLILHAAIRSYSLVIPSWSLNSEKVRKVISRGNKGWSFSLPKITNEDHEVKYEVHKVHGINESLEVRWLVTLFYQVLLIWSFWSWPMAVDGPNPSVFRDRSFWVSQKKPWCFGLCRKPFRPSTEVQMWEHSVCRHELKDVVIPWSFFGRSPGGIPENRANQGDPPGKIGLHPTGYLRVFACLARFAKIRRLGSRVCFFFFGWPEEESFGDGWNHDWFLKESDRTCVFCNIILWIHVMPWLMHTNGILTGLTLGCVWW